MLEVHPGGAGVLLAGGFEEGLTKGRGKKTVATWNVKSLEHPKPSE